MIPPVASQFIAGQKAEEAVERSQDLDDGITPIFNFLGEHYKKRKPVERTMRQYGSLIDEISDANRDMEISVKPTQVGLDIGETLFISNAEEIVDMCSEEEIFVWFDMEDESTVDSTIETYKYLCQEYPGQVGLCLQANMKRTNDDLSTIASLEDPSVRLVKGAYSPPSQVAYQSKQKVDENYRELIREGLDSVNGRFAVGSHDEDMIKTALEVDEPVADLEFQMLKGVRETRQTELSEEYPVGQYVPYGDKWISYTYRRIKERPRNIFLIGRAVKDSIF